MLKSCIAAGLIVFGVNSYAGVAGVTAHSRANCAGFNESVTWHLGHTYWWRVIGDHYPNNKATKPKHTLDTKKQWGYRAIAYHATEAYSSRGDTWWVNGYHYYYPFGEETLDVMTSVGDCSIYDGWWD